ncbi:MAG: CoB--CoM heterodisulfide reductase iron-sulfur subunit A family protein [Deltaproteobacteria bacterium]|nr:CoB--CoM heterodisulfide reductase iron-sulfur subunit A family protein [Deltaproteobacteria bacterium]
MDSLTAAPLTITDFMGRMDQEAHQALVQPLGRVVSARVLVVGGGVAGQQAALDAAALGLPVTLVEAGPSIGGVMARLDKTFPTNDCAMCILSPRMLEMARAPGIDILTLTRVRQIQGEPGDLQVMLSRRPRYVDEARCTGCGECVRVCPVGMPDPHNLGLSLTRAIHLPFPQAIPQAAVISAEACRLFRGKPCEACVQVCPTGAIDLQQTPQNRLLHVGAVIVATGASAGEAEDFPGAGAGDVVTSLQFERLLSAGGPHQGRVLRPSDLTEPSRLAFIQCAGSRDLHPGAASYCSSVCCLVSLKQALVARELCAPGLETAIFYMDLRAQGKGHEAYLRQAEEQGVRLIRSRVNRVEPRPGGGVRVRYADAGGRPREAAFDLAVLAVGLRPPHDLQHWSRVQGLALNRHGFIRAWTGNPAATRRPGILTCGAAQEPMDITQSVTTAGAAAQAAAQLLAVSSRTFPPRRPLPAAEPTAAPRIGVFLCHCGTNIARVIDLPRLGDGIRQLPGVAHVEDEMFACAVESTQRLAETIRTLGLNRVVVAACSPRTHEPLFREVAAGAGLNPGYVTMANIREQCAWVHQEEPEAAREKALGLVGMAVERARVLPPLVSRPVPVIPRALVLGGGVAGMSAAVCLADQGFHTYLIEREDRLGGVARRLHFTLEGLDPPTFVQELEVRVYRHPNIEVFTSAALVGCTGFAGNFRSTVRREAGGRVQERLLEHGVVLVATGGREFQPQGLYLYGEDPRVLTQLELEELIAGQASRLEKARHLVMIQCVGSREPEHPYCSRLCCSEAIKNSLALKERYPCLDLTILYRDVRAYGFREDYYREAKERGVRFLPFTPERPPKLTAAKRRPLSVWVWDELLQRELALAADLVILSAGIEPAPDNARLARLLGIPLTQEGFFLEAHQKLRPVETHTYGIFLCGLAHYPKSLGETVAQAQAAAGRAAAILFQTELAGGEITARIDQGRCRRCLTCLQLCPFGAVRAKADGRLEVEEELCRGCGTCTAECPAEAITLSRFTHEELEAQMRAALS